MPLITHPRNPDETYGPTTRGDFYKSKQDHRRTAQTRRRKGQIVKHRWCIKEGEEYCVFKAANEAVPEWWFCEEKNCLFGFIFENDRLMILGEDEEQIAKFPNDRNGNDPWHGYPVTTQEDQNRPSSGLLDKLVADNRISEEYRLRIKKGKI